MHIGAAVRGHGGCVELAVCLPLSWRLVNWLQHRLAYNGRRWMLAMSVHALQWYVGVEYERLCSGTRWLTLFLGPITADIVHYDTPNTVD